MKTYENNDECIIIADLIVAKTSKAILCEFGGEQKWLPLSQVDGDAEIDDTNVSIAAPFWLVEKSGLEDFISD